MKKEKIQDYTARISQCNRSELVVVVYELMLENISDAKEEYNAESYSGFIDSMKRTQNLLGDLMGALDYKYPISSQLFSLYLFWNKQITLSIVRKSPEPLEGIEGMIKKMKDAFDEVSKSDKSAPLMQNTQKVYAGLTYGRESLSEMADVDINRGFQA